MSVSEVIHDAAKSQSEEQEAVSDKVRKSRIKVWMAAIAFWAFVCGVIFGITMTYVYTQPSKPAAPVYQIGKIFAFGEGWTIYTVQKWGLAGGNNWWTTISKESSDSPNLKVSTEYPDCDSAGRETGTICYEYYSNFDVYVELEDGTTIHNNVHSNKPLHVGMSAIVKDGVITEFY